jgi:hypothetical protein
MTTKDPDSERSKPRTRLESELAEILERADRPPSNVIKFRAKARQSRSRWLDLKERTIGPDSVARRGGAGVLLLGSLAFATIGSFVNDSSHLLAYVFGVLALACFVGVFVLGFREPRGGQTKTWRGRDIEIEPPRPSWMNRKPKPPKR